MLSKKKNALFGRYPSCDMLNNAIRFIDKGKIDEALVEIIYAIEKANGYIYEDLKPVVQKAKDNYWERTQKDLTKIDL